MKRAILAAVLTSYAGGWALGQSAEAPARFEAADVRVSAKSMSLSPKTGPPRGGRYEFKNATMVDLIRTAYGFDADKVLGGPNWLEMDRFDVMAKVPADTTPETQRRMLQSLLEDRFKLVAHKDTKPLPAYALTAGKKPQLKEADGTGAAGCKVEEGSGSGPGIVIGSAVAAAMGTPTRIALGPGMTIRYICRNMTMEAFAGGLRSMMGASASLGPNPVMDQTELKGKYNFDLQYSIAVIAPGSDTGDRITIFDAVEKQLGLKLEPRQVPTPVLVVVSVNRKPGENPPGTAEALPPVPVPTEFEVASLKPTDPSSHGGRFQMQPGGRLVVQGQSLRLLINRAFNVSSNEQLQGLPDWTNTQRFDIMAQAPSEGSPTAGIDNEWLAPMLRSLLVNRFKITYHTEERPVTGYALMAVKPKLKKADPASRTFCKDGNAPVGAAPGTRLLRCQNMSMEQFAERLRGMSTELAWPVLDATEMAGGWDFTLSYSMFASIGISAPVAAAGRGGDAGQPGLMAASDPGGAPSVFEAIEKQLGLKLEKQKRAAQVIVIDHIEQKPIGD